MSDTQKPQSLAEIAAAAMNSMVDSALPLLQEWVSQNPSTERYYCSQKDCPGHTLKGTKLKFLEDSRLFSYNVNGNGFSAANAGTVTVDGEEIPLSVFWDALVTVTPVCPGAKLPTVRKFVNGNGTTKVQFSTRVVENDVDEGETSDKASGRGRGRGRRRGNNA